MKKIILPLVLGLSICFAACNKKAQPVPTDCPDDVKTECVKQCNPDCPKCTCTDKQLCAEKQCAEDCACHKEGCEKQCEKKCEKKCEKPCNETCVCPDKENCKEHACTEECKEAHKE